jgi:hypothetical protein
MKMNEWMNVEDQKTKKVKELTVPSIDDDERLANWLHTEENEDEAAKSQPGGDPGSAGDTGTENKGRR